MNAAARTFCYFKSTIGQKQLMALTGLAWCGFVLSHMLGNILLFVSAEAYNKYSHALVSNPLIYLAEAFLVLTLLAHIGRGVAVTIRNRQAKHIANLKGLSGEKNSSFAVKTMIFQGVLIFLFVVYHLVTFKFGTVYMANYGGVEMRDIHKLVVEVFQSPTYVLFYVVMMWILALHLSHGFHSSLQTLGLHHPKYNSKIKCLSHLYAGAVSIGFALQPLYVFFFHQV